MLETKIITSTTGSSHMTYVVLQLYETSFCLTVLHQYTLNTIDNIMKLTRWSKCWCGCLCSPQ